MTLTMIMITISITTHNNTRAMRNTEYSSYNYEGGTQVSSQFNNEDNSTEHDETQGGLLCEEDEIDTLYDMKINLSRFT